MRSRDRFKQHSACRERTGSSFKWAFFYLLTIRSRTTNVPKIIKIDCREQCNRQRTFITSPYFIADIRVYLVLSTLCKFRKVSHKCRICKESIVRMTQYIVRCHRDQLGSKYECHVWDNFPNEKITEISSANFAVYTSAEQLYLSP